MNIKKFEVLLKKINTLKQNIDLSGENISKLEMDLLKNYIKGLYETIEMGNENLENDFQIEDSKKGKKKKKEKLVGAELPDEEAFEEEEVFEEEKEVKDQAVEEKPEESPKKENLKEYDNELLAIFEKSFSSDLSEKLSSSPITDIKKAIGINDRIFTINELFGGDKEVFNSAIDQLNKFDKFEDARDFLLANFAGKYNWAQNENLKKAKRFVKLVGRRYL